MISSSQTRVPVALIAVYQRDGRATVRSVVAEAGMKSPGSALRPLKLLRDAGLIAWEPGKAGTLRPLVQPVPYGEAA